MTFCNYRYTQTAKWQSYPCLYLISAVAMPEGGRAVLAARRYMRKSKLLLLALLTAVLLIWGGVALAADADPIVCSIEVDPDKLSGPGTVNVTITIANSGDTDMRDPVVLYDPSTKIVSDFGTNGAALLKAGESKTWTGAYEVNQRTLDNGSMVFYAKYNIYKDSGEAVPQSQSIRGTIAQQKAEADIDVKRTITPSAAKEGQEVVVKYEIQNSGTVNLTKITIQEHKDINSKKQTIDVLKPGSIAEIKYPVTMGKDDLTSGATITYQTEESSKKQTYTVENMKIINGESSLEAKLTSSSKGVPVNEKIKLTLTVKNKGSVGVSDLRASDAKLGEVFSGQEIAAGKTLTLEKEITLTETTDYAFSIVATDATGAQVTATTEAVSVTTVDPGDVLTLSVTATPDKTEVFESPGLVRFSIVVANNSRVAANNVAVKHGETTLYTFETIPAGETRKLTRDTALSMAGKYRFTVTAQDPLENDLTFDSNEMQIAFSVPTPAPATATPVPDPTPEPTFQPVTMPPIADGSIGALPKAVQSVLLPVLILAGVLLIGAGVLLVIATKRRAEQKKAAESALDQLERAKRRDYVTPADEQEDTAESQSVNPMQSHDDDDSLLDYDLPSVDDVRKASVTDNYRTFNEGLYDEEMTSDLNQYSQGDDGYDQTTDVYAPQDGYDQATDEVLYEQPYQDDGLTDAYESDGYTDGFQDSGYAAGDSAYGEEYDGQVVDGHIPDDRENTYYSDDETTTDGNMGEHDVQPRPASRRSRAERGSDTPAEL